MCEGFKMLGLLVLLFFLSTPGLSNVFGQEKFPTRPITFIISFPPGGNIDTSY